MMHIVYVTGDFADKDGDVLTGMTVSVCIAYRFPINILSKATW